jgi:2-polyprenyl-3-methyl-5-hydroxy-6-metoxy-1,4-benzoquinol methylase
LRYKIYKLKSTEIWESVYKTKQLSEVSWFEPTPQVSLDFLAELSISKDAAIIDIGGGDSYFVDHLLQLGYTDITVLDISAIAIERAKARLGSQAAAVKWIVSDITDFVPQRQYNYWHDRAAFHFLTAKKQVQYYLKIANKAVSPAGKMVIGTFSEKGPKKCSGLPIKQYSDTSLAATTKKWFQKIKCIHTDHNTPFNTIQHFLFCSFQKSIL